MLALALLAGSLTATAQRPLAAQVESADAQEYADRYGVAVDEAEAALSAMYAPRPNWHAAEQVPGFAGAWYEHAPFRQVVGVVSLAAADQIRERVPELAAIPHRFELRSHPIDALRADMQAVSDALRIAGVDASVSLSAAESSIDIITTEAERANALLDNVPVDTSIAIEVHQAESKSSTVGNLYGGYHLSCGTSGFSVRKGSVYGVTDAGHCTNTVSYNGVNLPYKGGYWGGNVDMQWHEKASYTVKPWVYDGQWDSSTPYYRVITWMVGSGNIQEGTWVCKYGKSTGYGCGEIIDDSYQPDSACVPSAGTTFRKIDNTYDLANSGDSGGPAFLGSGAAGTVICQEGWPWDDQGIFMPVYNGLNHLGLTLLTG